MKKTLLLWALLVCGCDPRVSALTEAPPTAVAELDTSARSVRLSEGIAFAMECISYSGTSCENASAASADVSIAQVFPAFVDMVAPGDAYQRSIGDEPRAVFVVVGEKPGDTTISITSGDGDLDVAVKVLSLGTP